MDDDAVWEEFRKHQKSRSLSPPANPNELGADFTEFVRPAVSATPASQETNLRTDWNSSQTAARAQAPPGRLVKSTVAED